MGRFSFSKSRRNGQSHPPRTAKARRTVRRQRGLSVETLERRELLAANTVGLISIDEARASDGYTLFSPQTGRDSYLINNRGQVVNQWHSDYNAGLTGYLTEDGDLVRGGVLRDNVNGTLAAPGASGIIEKFNWEGEKTWSYVYSTNTELSHHDLEVMPNGNVLVMVWEFRSGAESRAAGRNPNKLSLGYLLPDVITEVKPTGPTTGEVVWEWKVWDHLVQQYDPTKENYGIVADNPQLIDLNYVSTGPGKGANAADWTHNNGIDYNAELDQIMISSREFSEFWIIDHSTTTEEAAGHTGGTYGKGGDLLYRWGNPRAYNGGTRAEQQLFYQHDAEWIEEGKPGAGNVIVHNNGTDRVGGANYTSVDEIVLPYLEDGSYDLDAKPATPVHRNVATPLTGYYSPIISGQTRLENGNTLITNGIKGTMVEATPDGEVVWQYINPVTSPAGPLYQGQQVPGMNVLGIPGVQANLVFKAEHYPADYPAFAGREITPSGTVELYRSGLPISIGVIDVSPISGNQDEEYIELVNANSSAVDISGWSLDNAVEFTFLPGTVIPAGGVLYVAKSQTAFATRTTGPGGGQGFLVAGNYSGDLSPEGETIELLNPRLETVDQKSYGRTNTPPVIDVIANQNITRGSSTGMIEVIVTDPDTAAADLAYRVQTDPLPYIIDQKLNLSAPILARGDLPYHQNYRGSNERYVINLDAKTASDRWYYLLPNGELYRFTGNVNSPAASALRGDLIVKFAPAVYQNPSLLVSAQPSGIATTATANGGAPAKVEVTPSSDFIGTIPVTVTVTDGAIERYQVFQVNVQPGERPSIDPIDPITLVAGQSTTIDLSFSDSDTPAEELQFEANAESLLAKLDEHWGFSKPVPANYYLNFRGSAEKYVTNPAAPLANQWFYILPNGDLYRFTGNVLSSSPASLTGEFLANVGVEAYANPALLTDPIATAVPFEFQFLGIPVNQLSITASESYVGVHPVTVTVSDADYDVSLTFEVTVLATPPGETPVLSPIDNQSIAAGVELNVPLIVTDPDTGADSLSYSVSVNVEGTVPKPNIPLTVPNTGAAAKYYENFRGSQERYLLNPSGVHPNRWYYILPNGDFYRFTGDVASHSPSSLTGVLIGNFTPAAYQDPSLLLPGTTVQPVSASITGGSSPVLKVRAASGFVGNAQISVVVSDGQTSDSESFQVVFTTPKSPVIAAIGNQTLAPGASTTVPLDITDPDTPLDQVTITATATSLAGELNAALNLTQPATGSFPAYYRNFRGSDEKYLFDPTGVDPSRWYYLTTSGDLYRFTGNVAASTPSSLTGEFVASLGVPFYDNPALLHEATLPAPALTTQLSGTNLLITASSAFAQPVRVTLTANDGVLASKQTFLISPGNVASAEPRNFTVEPSDWQPQSSLVSLSIFGDPQAIESLGALDVNRSATDVNGDGVVTALDALQIINFLNSVPEMEKAQAILDSIFTQGVTLDTSGDGEVTAIDALRVINDLNNQSQHEAEEEAAWPMTVDSVHSQQDDETLDWRDERIGETLLV